MALLPRKDISTIFFCDECSGYLVAEDVMPPWREFHIIGWPGLWHACCEECALKIQTWCIVESLKDGAFYESENRN